MEGDDIEVPVFITGINFYYPKRRRRKLSDQHALEIYQSRKPFKVLSIDYNVSYATIKAIKTRRYYKNIHERNPDEAK